METRVERHEIETFLALAEELHFGRTAERLGRTTARVSQTIRVLERRVGVPLFERTSRRVALTGTGRRLYEDLRPAYDQVTAALVRAVADGRGLTGVLRVGFVGAATGQLVVDGAERFRRRHTGCEVRLNEVQFAGAVDRLRADELDLLFGCFPFDEPDLTCGPALLSEPRMLAVPARHPLAGRPSASVEDLAGSPLLVAPCSIPEYRPDPARRTPGGRPIVDGPSAQTFQEVLTLIGAGQGVFVVGEHATRFHARPDVAYVPLHDAPPLRWGPVWRTVRTTERVRAFVAATAEAPRR
ncbi:LysR family transcriptional regulator [Dactylosporangium siamense]|uniref:LysR family transcriptional regulator n=1 Tax=Dactylosporangium siamense TaxID=685454 RepID=UPI0019413986|nr:LysR substrate-binding domain-containing protein [Dactylosporangium siamense]